LKNQLETLVKELNQQIVSLERENSRLHKELDACNENLTIYKTVINKILTPLQTRIMVEGMKRANWTEVEMAKAILLKKVSSKAYDLVRTQWNIPLPCDSLIRKWCSEIDFQPGILHSILRLLKEKFVDSSTMYRQCVMGLDEMSIESEIAYDQKHDVILGPFKKMMVVCVRGLFKAWKQPIYFGFDIKMTKEWLFDIIRAVENSGLSVHGIAICAKFFNINFILF